MGNYIFRLRFVEVFKNLHMIPLPVGTFRMSLHTHTHKISHFFYIYICTLHLDVIKSYFIQMMHNYMSLK